jgi:hypothetical protein
VQAFAAGQRERSPLPFLTEARRLYDLVTEGHNGLHYSVARTYWGRDAGTGKPVPGTYTEEWRAALDCTGEGLYVPRRLSPQVVAKHIAGDYDVAWQWPSWTSLAVLDIDCHVREGASMDEYIEAQFRRDAVLAELWRAFEFDAERQPVLLLTPRGGYHLYLPLSRGGEHAERTWPAAWLREHLEHFLAQRGIGLQPGRLELWPAGQSLRLPCGAGMALLRPGNPQHGDDLRLELVGASWQSRANKQEERIERVLVRQRAALVTAFLEAIEEARRPLGEWLGAEEPLWHPVWGPWGLRAKKAALSPHKEDVRGEGGLGPSPAPSDPYSTEPSPGGVLLYGQAFRDRIEALAAEGLSEEGTRHDAVLKLVWHWGVVCGLEKEEALGRLAEWLEAHSHLSATQAVSPRRFVADSLREAGHYWDRHVVPLVGAAGSVGRGRGRVDRVLRPLPEIDREAVLPGVVEAVRPEAALVLQFLRNAASVEGVVANPVSLSGARLKELCGERRVCGEGPDGPQRRRAAVMAVEELVRLGVLQLHTDYATGRHGRLYTCWYRFGSGALPTADGGGALVLAVREVEEGRLEVVAGADGPQVRILEPRVAAEPPQEPRCAGSSGQEGDSQERAAGGVQEPSGMGGQAPASVPSGREQEPWWVRMYLRRAFSPAEFLDGDARRLVPGPFRHRFASAPRSALPTSPALQGPGERERGTGAGPPASLEQAAGASGLDRMAEALCDERERPEAVALRASPAGTEVLAQVVEAASPGGPIAGAPEDQRGQQVAAGEDTSLEAAIAAAWAAFETRRGSG